MHDPWTILGLNAAKADEKQVRTAYARLLKIHRPETDPDGFRDLREAYEYALAMVKQPARRADDENQQDEAFEALDAEPPVAPSTALLPSWGDDHRPSPGQFADADAAVPPSREPSIPPRQHLPDRNWPREWSFAIESLENAASCISDAPDHMAQALTALALDAREYDIPGRALELILRDAFRDDLAALAVFAPAVLLTELLQCGEAGIRLLAAMFEAVRGAEHAARRATFARRLERCAEEAFHDDSSALVIQVAESVATDSPSVARSLIHLLQRRGLLAPHQEAVSKTRVLINQGQAFLSMTPEHRRFWSQRIAAPDAPCDWKSEPAASALVHAVISGNQAPFHTLVRHSVPTEVWENAWRNRPAYLLRWHLDQWVKSGVLLRLALSIAGTFLLILGAHRSTEQSHPPPTPLPSEKELRRMSREQFLEWLKSQNLKTKADPKANTAP